MSSAAPLSQDQRALLAALLQSRLAGLEQERASQLQGLSQAESARQTLLQDADDARQRAGAHEVEGTVLEIDSAEFNEIRQALQRIHTDVYGLCGDCHALIPFDRLRVEPQARRCAACQTLHERRLSP
jgi:DnaK suppressor protein